MNTLTAQPNTYAVVGVDEASPSIFVLPVIGWVEHASSINLDRFDPIALAAIGLEEATKSAIVSGDAIVFQRTTQAGKFTVHIIDIVIGEVPDVKNYIDRFKMVLRNRKVK